MARHDVVIQLGHCFRKRGATGTSGMWQGRRRTEQEFVEKVGRRMASILNAAGIDTRVTLADETVPSSLVFVALHQDGSESRTARGASVGYPSVGDGGRLGQIWKALYQLAGWPSGFRPDNYTAALRGYYGFRRSNATARLLIEHGFATNPDDQAWMWTRWADIAHVNAAAVAHYLGRSLTGDQTSSKGRRRVLFIHKTNVYGLPIAWLEAFGVTSAIGPETAIDLAEQGVEPIELTIDQIRGLRERATNLDETTADRHWRNLAKAIDL